VQEMSATATESTPPVAPLLEQLSPFASPVEGYSAGSTSS
jgi:hypothetical protein